MMKKKTVCRVFAACSLVLIWSLFSVTGAKADRNEFNDHNDGTVEDSMAALTWQKGDSGVRKTWSEALEYVEGLNTENNGSGLGGCRGWRLPTSKELKRLVDHSKHSGHAHIDDYYFPNTKADMYWSSSSKKHSTLKYAISFEDGRQRKMSSNNRYYVKAVRDQCSPADHDGDLYDENVDCDDHDPYIHPGAVEIACDGVDNDCVGGDDQSSCQQDDHDRDGYTEADGDCDDGDPFRHPGVFDGCDGVDNNCDGNTDEGLTIDYDGDGHSTPDSCSGTKDDCDDDDGGRYPGAVELCDNIDNNCNGVKDENLTRQTTCGVGACAGNTGIETCALGVWGYDTCDPFIGATAETCNGLDDDCNGTPDNGIADIYTGTDTGECRRGIQGCVDGAIAVTQTEIGPSSESCDGLDNNCNGQIDDGLTFDVDGDGHSTVGSCGGTKDDCDDADANNFPTNPEICDGADNDCDGTPDNGLAFTTYYQDGDSDTFGNAAASLSSCSGVPAGYVADDSDCNDAAAGIHPGASDANCDGIDQNCFGGADEEYVSTATSCGVGACAADGVTSCVDGSVVDSCVAGIPASNDATCDGVDNDCNGQTDEDYVFTWTSCGVGACEAIAMTTCVDGAVVDNCVAGQPAAADDVSCDGIDQNCNGVADEDYVSTPTSCGTGVCVSTGTTSCVGGSVADNCTPGTPSPELCDGLDNDCDNQIDEGVTSTYYMDSDNDGFGNPDITDVGCSADLGFVVDNTDCDDTNGATNPGASEICGADGYGDDIDNNCNTVVDEGCNNPPFYSSGGGCYFASFQEAYAGIADGGIDILLLQAVTFDEAAAWTFNRNNVVVTLVGGYDPNYTDPATGMTTISLLGGPALVISDGTVIADGIILQ